MGDRKYRVLLAHNHYGDYVVGGEASVFKSDAKLLSDFGHSVQLYERTNYEFKKMSIPEKISAVYSIPWSKKSYREIGNIFDEFKPDILHVHNYKFLLTPSIFAAAKDRGIATALTMHNYRLACPCGWLMQHGKPCMKCIGNKKSIGYHLINCRRERGVMSDMLNFHLYYSTLRRKRLVDYIDAYIALSEMGRDVFIKSAIPEKKIFVKPNSVSDPLLKNDKISKGYGALYCGRLSSEKGIMTMIKTWNNISYPLTIIGDGELMKKASDMAGDHITFKGYLPYNQTMEYMKKCAFTIFPSECYETFGLSLMESMACGKPVIASDIGARKDMIEHGVNGFLFKVMNAESLKETVEVALSDGDKLLKIGKNARKYYLEHCTPEENIITLNEIYNNIKQWQISQCHNGDKDL